MPKKIFVLKLATFIKIKQEKNNIKNMKESK